MQDFRNKGCQENVNEPAVEPETGERSKVEKLVVQAVNGNTDAFGELYIIHVEKIYRYIFYHVKSKTVTEDITAEVFLKAWRVINSCRGREYSFSAWLYRIAHNHVIDHFRASRQHISLDETLLASIPYPEKEVERWLMGQVLELMSSLPPQQRQIIILKFIEGFSNQEIGRILNKSQGAIRITQMRALSRLRKHLTKTREWEDGT